VSAKKRRLRGMAQQAAGAKHEGTATKRVSKSRMRATRRKGDPR
jgi:hypothetical protein